MQDAFSCLLIFPGGNDHAGVRHGDADAGNDLGENVIVDSVVELIRVDVVGMFQTRNADRVRSDAECRFQMFRVHQ